MCIVGRSHIFADFASVTPRRWLDQCNHELSDLITKTLKIEKKVWLKDLTKLEGLLAFTEDKNFREQWAAIKQRNKERLARHVQTTLGLTVRTDAMFDVQIKVWLFYNPVASRPLNNVS